MVLGLKVQMQSNLKGKHLQPRCSLGRVAVYEKMFYLATTRQAPLQEYPIILMHQQIIMS